MSKTLVTVVAVIALTSVSACTGGFGGGGSPQPAPVDMAGIGAAPMVVTTTPVYTGKFK